MGHSTRDLAAPRPASVGAGPGLAVGLLASASPSSPPGPPRSASPPASPSGNCSFEAPGPLAGWRPERSDPRGLLAQGVSAPLPLD